MPVENALILAAGKGTRMGEIGKKLPKVLWPVFEKSILELEVAYARELGAKNIFINSHYYTEELLKAVKTNESFANVEILIEEEPIDIGGAVHNLAKGLNYRGNLIVLNSDQFIMLDTKSWENAYMSFEKKDALIFAYEVSKEDKYNGLELKNGHLAGIKKNEDYNAREKMLTYTGMALIKLDKLEKSYGNSKFFETVANPERLEVAVQSIESSPYWDFGTLRRYWESCFKALESHAENDGEPFVEFLKRQGALISDKAGPTSYGVKADQVIDLDKNTSNKIKNKIILKAPGEAVNESLAKEDRFIIYEDIAQRIP